MSTPITHNQLFTISVIETLKKKRQYMPYKAIYNVAVEAVKSGAGLYNYPDAVQAIKREDGSILSRRVTHFENAKDLRKPCNSHQIFTPRFLRTVKENEKISAEYYHDANDQQGDIKGQPVNWVAFNDAIRKYKETVTEEIERAYCLADLYVMHNEIADFFNGVWVNNYVKCLPDGCIIIGNKEFDENNKKEAYKIAKNIFMKLQENTSADLLSKYNVDLEVLNSAIEQSYRETYSDWLAKNTLKYVKEITLEPAEITSEDFELLEEVGISIDVLTKEAEQFVKNTVLLTSDRLSKIIVNLLPNDMRNNW